MLQDILNILGIQNIFPYHKDMIKRNLSPKIAIQHVVNFLINTLMIFLLICRLVGLCDADDYINPKLNKKDHGNSNLKYI